MFRVVLLIGLFAYASSLNCNNDCQKRQHDALVELYRSLDGPNWLRQQGWTSATSDHCLWEGVKCCTPTTAVKSVSCQQQGAVTGLDLSVNNITGPWPASALLGLAQSLQTLDFRGNGVYGSIGADISELQLLLNFHVDDNRLTGTLPDSLGQLGNLTRFTGAANRLAGSIPASLSQLQQLQWLLLNDNELTGQMPPELLAMPQLRRLALQGNMLQGPLPTGAVKESAGASRLPLQAAGTVQGSAKLTEVQLGQNQFTGPVTEYIALLPTLLLDISHNKLTGSLPEAFSRNGVLQQLYLGNNQLSGSLSPSMLSPSLQVLELSSNQFTGTVPSFGAAAFTLETVDLSNNSLSGPLPVDFGRLVTLQHVDLSGNNFTAGDGLPSSIVVDSSQPALAINPALPALLCHPVVLARNPSVRLTLDPSTYAYEGCACQNPWQPVVDRDQSGNIISMTCRSKEDNSPPLAHIVGPLAALLGVALVALVCVAAAWRWGLGGFVQRLSEQVEKKAPPGSSAKEVTLVLTDVQGSTELWEWDQQLASEAFQLHDRVLRQYMTHFYGYEVSTEGDAFLVAFHEPFDAVAWCLCVQLALHYAEWPAPLLQHKSTCLDTAESLEAKRRHQQDNWQHRISKAARQGSGGTPQNGAAGLEGNAWTGGTDNLMQATLAAADDDYCDSSSGGNALEPQSAALTFSADATDNKGVARSVLFRGLRVRMSVATGGVDAVRLHSVTQRAEYVGEVLRKVHAVGETPQGGQIIMDSDTFRGIHARLPELGSIVLEATQKLLRSKVGPSAQELANMFGSPPELWAKDAMDYMNTTQILPRIHSDEDMLPSESPSPAPATRASANGATIAANDATERSPMLAQQAARSSQGSNAGLPVASNRRRSSRWLSVLGFGAPNRMNDIEEGSSPKPDDNQGLLQRAAALLPGHEPDDDSNRCSAEHLATFAADRAPTSPTWRPSLMGLGRSRKQDRQAVPAVRQGLLRERRRSSLSYGVTVIDMGVHQLSGLPQKLNLVQVMPCGLEDRARFFPRLDSLRQETPGYFDAPAAGMVPLSPCADFKGITIPPVTIVFCTIDKYGDLIESSRSAAELALELYNDCVRWLLLVGGGYECQESEGTFMVAFSSPDVAIEWCLMVQQVLKDMSWPASVLELPTCEEERDMHGNVMFRGPRVKMGVYTGTPTRVMPHTTTGRADYFGPLVNRAARYCHAAARGGQVLVPKELMLEVISKWVMIDPVELLQSDRLLEFAAFFDEDRRLWPWMFKRRSQWDMAMPAHFYPSIPPPPPVMGPLWQQAAAAAATTPFVPVGTDATSSFQQHVNQHEHAAGRSPRAAADKTHGPQFRAHFADELKPGAAGSPAMNGNSGAASAAAEEECQLMSAADQLRPLSESAILADIAHIGRLAPLREAAEGNSSKCTSEVGEAHSEGRAEAHTAQPARLPPRPRRHSDISHQYSRLGPQHLQALQAHYAQGLAASGGPTSGPAYDVLQQQGGFRNAPGPAGQLNWPTLEQPAYMPARYRRPSYVSDVSSQLRHNSNHSDGSALHPSSAGNVSMGMGPWGPEAGSRRPSALSEFFPNNGRSRRPSNLSMYDVPGWSSLGAATGGSQVESEVTSVGTTVTAANMAQASSAQQRQLQVQYQQQQQAQQLQRQLQQYQWQQRQTAEQQLRQYMQPGAPWRWQMLRSQRSGSVSSGTAAPAAPAQVQGPAAGPVASPPQVINQQAAGVQSPLQQLDTTVVAGPIPSATAQSIVSNVPSLQAHQSGGIHTLQTATAVQRAGGSAAVSVSSQQQIDRGSSQRKQSGSDGNSTIVSVPAGASYSVPLSHVGSSVATGSKGDSAVLRNPPTAAQVPAAVLLQGIENQVIPGMLHSSNRLRLVSKRRRQMSYCFFQETSKPGVPADGADPKRLVGYGGYGFSTLPQAGPPSSPPSNYAGSEAGGSAAGAHPGGLIVLGSNQGSVHGTRGSAAEHYSAGASRMGSSRTSATESDTTQKSVHAAQRQQSHAADGSAPDTAATAAANGSNGSIGLVPEGLVEGSTHGQVDGCSAGLPNAAGAPSQPFWGPSLVDDYCGLPEIEPLPDVEMLESLRLAAARTRCPSTVSTVTDSVAGFEGPNIGKMCADIMRGRWLWIGELLVHDLGQFRFKGVAGVHSIVSVTSEELGGRTFPTTIRRGKGEQIRLGRGLLANVQMRPRARIPGWGGAYAGQQLLQNPAPGMGQDLTGQAYMSAGLGLCHACSGVGLQTLGSITGLMDLPGIEQSGMSGLAPSTTPHSYATIGGQSLCSQHQHYSGNNALPVSGAGSGYGSLTGIPVPDRPPLLRIGSVSDVRSFSAAPGTQQVPVIYNDGDTGPGTGVVSSSNSSSVAGYHYLNPAVHPSHMPSEGARQHWQMQLVQQHLWQQQQALQQQRRLQRRRHSVCVGSVHRRLWTRPYGVQAEMYPFEEAEEGSSQLPSQKLQSNSKLGKVASPHAGSAKLPQPEGTSNSQLRTEMLPSIDGFVPAATAQQQQQRMLHGSVSFPDLADLHEAVDPTPTTGEVSFDSGCIVSCPDHALQQTADPALHQSADNSAGGVGGL